MERSGLETLAAHDEPYCAYMLPSRSLQYAFPNTIYSAVRPAKGSKRIVEAAECSANIEPPYSNSNPTPCNVADDPKVSSGTFTSLLVNMQVLRVQQPLR